MEPWMICETCDTLLADYGRAVDTFKTAVEKSRGAVGADACYAAKLAADLADNCWKVGDRLIEHWRTEHRRLAAKSGSR